MSIIKGTIYNDNLIGAFADDDIFGKAGNDTLWGFGGDDLLDGYTGDDSLIGGAGGDILLGYAGDDSLLGGAGTDVIGGETGDDILNGYGHTNWEYDILSGGYGADTFVLGNIFGAFYERSGFATVTDFESAAGDQLQVFGNSGDYSLLEFDGGTDIYYQDDLIGYVSNTTEITLENNFIFV